MDLSPTYYHNRRLSNNDTTNILAIDVTPNEVSIWEKDREVVTTATPSTFFPLHSNIPAAMEMMLYHRYLDQGMETLPTLPRGEVSLCLNAAVATPNCGGIICEDPSKCGTPGSRYPRVFLPINNVGQCE